MPLYHVLMFSGTAFLGPPQSILLHPATVIHNSVVDYHIFLGIGLRSSAHGAPLLFSLLPPHCTDLRLMISISLTKAANKVTYS